MALFIYLQHDDLHHISHLYGFAGMAESAVADLGNVDQTVLMDANIHKHTKVDDIPNGTGEYHARLQILHFQHILSQDGGGKFVAGVAAGLCQFLGNVNEGRLANAAAFSSPGGAELLQLAGEVRTAFAVQ